MGDRPTRLCCNKSHVAAHSAMPAKESIAKFQNVSRRRIGTVMRSFPSLIQPAISYQHSRRCDAGNDERWLKTWAGSRAVLLVGLVELALEEGWGNSTCSRFRMFGDSVLTRDVSEKLMYSLLFFYRASGSAIQKSNCVVTSRFDRTSIWDAFSTSIDFRVATTRPRQGCDNSLEDPGNLREPHLG